MYRYSLSTVYEIASQIFSINLCMTVVSYIILGFLLYFGKSLESYRTLIIIQSTIIVLTTLGADWINTVLEDFKYITYRTLFFQLFSLVAMLIFVRHTKDYLIYAAIMTIASGGGNICNIIYRRKYCKIVFTLKMSMIRHFIPIITMFALVLSQTVFTNLDMTMIGLFRGDVEVGLYSIAMKIYNVTNTTVASIVYVVLPQLSTYYKTYDYININKILSYSLNYIILLGLPLITGLNVMAKEIVIIIGGKEYVDAAITLRILTAALLFSLIGGFIGNIIFMSSGREKIALMASVVAALANGISNLMLIPKFGYNAAAMTTVLAELISVIVLVGKVEKKIKTKSIWSMLKCPAIGSVSIGLICISLKYMIRIFWLKTVLCIICSIIVYGLTLIIGKDEFALNAIAPIKEKIKRFKRIE